MSERCTEREMFGDRQCDRPAGHFGVHVAGVDIPPMTAWPVLMWPGIPTAVPTRETVRREWKVPQS